MKRVLLFSFITLLSYLFIQNENILAISSGIAIFLFGMIFLEEGFRIFAGGVLEKVLKVATNTLSKSIGFGIVCTTLMQSSSLVSVISISFLSAGFISLYQGIGIIFGANLGTTTSAWLVAVFGLKINLATYAMPMLIFGIIFFLQSERKSKGFGQILIGLGFLFLGIAYMRDGFEAFRATIDLTQYAIKGYKGLFVFVFIGIAGTVIMQSSSAMFVIIITALASSQVTYPNAIALAIGSNIGTTITAILGSISSDISGKRLAVAHTIFNLVTGILAIVFVYQFIDAVEYSSKILGIAKDNFTYKLALFHTYFNIVGILVMTPFISKLVNLLNHFIKQKSFKKDEVAQSLFLNEAALDFADTSTKVLYKETKHLYTTTFEIVAKGLSVYKEDILSNIEVDEIIKQRQTPLKIDMQEYYNLKIKNIYSEIMSFAIRAQGKFEEETNAKIIDIKTATLGIIEVFKATKHMQKNMLKFIASDNEYIKEQYNYIRANIIKQLRQSQIIFNTDEEDVAMLLINKLELESKKYDISANKAIDNLIRNKHITYTMATSLMNDNVYASTISKYIIEATKALYLTHMSHSKEILLTEEEIKDTIKENKKV